MNHPMLYDTKLPMKVLVYFLVQMHWAKKYKYVRKKGKSRVYTNTPDKKRIENLEKYEKPSRKKKEVKR